MWELALGNLRPLEHLQRREIWFSFLLPSQQGNCPRNRSHRVLVERQAKYCLMEEFLYLGFLSLLKQVRMCSRWGCRKTPAARRAGRSRLPSSRTSINLSVCLNCNYPSTNKVRKRKAVTRKDYFTHDDYPVSARLWFVISFSGVVEVFRVAYSCSYRRVCQKLSVCSRVLGRKSRKF